MPSHVTTKEKTKYLEMQKKLEGLKSAVTPADRGHSEPERELHSTAPACPSWGSN